MRSTIKFIILSLIISLAACALDPGNLGPSTSDNHIHEIQI